MKTYILLGLLVAGALVAPAASAHLLMLTPDGEGGCARTEIGRPNIGPHPTLWVSPCGPAYHTGSTLP